MAVCNNIHPNGIGQSVGDSLVTRSPLYTSGSVWFVHGADGNDSWSGVNPTNPFATLAQAVASAGDDDIIVLMDNHAETIAASITVSERLTIVGAGQSDGKPTAKLTANIAADELLDVTGNHVELRNIWFEEDAQANSAARIRVTGTDFRMVGCYLECDENSNSTAGVVSLATGWGSARFEGSTFVSTATDASDPPRQGIGVTTGDHLELDGVVFDGGTVGWQSSIVATPGLFISGTVTRIKGVGISLLRGSDIAVLDACTGYLSVSTASYDSRVYCYSAG